MSLFRQQEGGTSHRENEGPFSFCLLSVVFILFYSLFLALNYTNSNYFRGNKRVDYLCMEPSGRTTATLQGDDGSLEDVGQVKSTEDYDRANFHFADADGKREPRHLTSSPPAVHCRVRSAPWQGQC